MPQITRESLMTLEAYAKARNEYRRQVMAHKKNRQVHLGQNLTLIFEDELTVRYQIQEMLRIEKTYEEEGIQDELEAYNPLVPDGGRDPGGDGRRHGRGGAAFRGGRGDRARS